MVAKVAGEPLALAGAQIVLAVVVAVLLGVVVFDDTVGEAAVTGVAIGIGVAAVYYLFRSRR